MKSKIAVFFFFFLFLMYVEAFGVYLFKRSVGQSGKDIGQFDYPVCVFFRQGKFYVSDWKNNRLQIFRENWYFEQMITDIPEPVGVVVLSSGEIIVASKSTSQLYKFDQSGNLISKIGKEGVKKGEFYHPRGLAVDKSDFIYVVDCGNKRVQKIDKDGKVYKVFEYLKANKSCVPRGCALDETGNLYVVYSTENEIVKFSPEGRIIRVINAKNSGYVGQFSQLRYVEVDILGNIFATDYENGSVVMFDEFGKFVQLIGKKGKGRGELLHPEGLCTLYNGQLVVCNSDNDRIEIFESDDYSKSYKLARFYEKKGDIENALKYYEQSYSFDPNNKKVISFLKKIYYQKMDSFYKEGKFDKALYYSKKIIEIDPAEKTKLKKKIENIKFKINRWIYISLVVVIIIISIFIYLFVKIS